MQKISELETTALNVVRTSRLMENRARNGPPDNLANRPTDTAYTHSSSMHHQLLHNAPMLDPF